MTSQYPEVRRDHSWWYAKALYAVVAGQLAWLLIIITAIRGRTEEQWAAQEGVGASINRFVSFMLTLGVGSDMQRQIALASRIRYETEAASILAWALGWVTVLFVTATVIRNGDMPKRFSSDTVKALIAVSCLCLVVGIFAPFIEMHAKMNVVVIGTIVPKFEEKTIVSAISVLFHSGNWIVGCLILLFSVFTPIAKLVFARIALGSVSNERRASIKKTLDVIGKWSMADVFVVAVLLACLAIRAADTSTDAHPLWGFYYFLTYCLLSMVVSFALGHLEPESGNPPERVALQPSTIATRALLSIVCFCVSGYLIIYLSLGGRAANAATASVYNPNELHDSVEQLPLHSTSCIPFSMPRNGTCTTKVNVSRGNSLNIFVVLATQVDAVKAGGHFFFIRGSEMLGTRSYFRSLPLVRGEYVLVLRDKDFKGVQFPESEVRVHITLNPAPAQ